MTRRLTAFICGRIVEGFEWGMTVEELVLRFRISRPRVERALRRAEERAMSRSSGSPESRCRASSAPSPCRRWRHGLNQGRRGR